MEDMEICPACTSNFESKGFIGVKDNVIPNNPQTIIISVSDLSPPEAAISIDHILEMILSGMKTASLKSCRLVSSRWKEFGARQLQKRVSLDTYFCYKMLLDADNHCYYSGDQYMVTHNVPRGITPSRDESSPGSVPLINLILPVMSSSTNFPCTSFVMSTETLSSPQILSFLSVAGPSIQRLRLVLVLYVSSSPPFHSPIMTELKTLLMTQCPHLERFDLQLSLQDPDLKKKIRETPHDDTHENSETTSDSYQENPVNKMSLPHLKYLTLRSQVPFQFFTQILEGATNLKAYYGLGYSEYFTEQDGRWRLDLLKELDFELSVFGSDSSGGGVLSHILSSHHRNTLRLEWIRITISKAVLIAPGEYSISTWTQLVRAVSILNDLLDTSRLTLKKLTLPSLRALSGLRIPRMPQLKSLVLLKPPHHHPVNISLDKHFFPPQGGVNNDLSLFPVLNAISIVSLNSEDTYNSDVRTLVNFPWPMPKIRFLRVDWPNYISRETRNLVSRTLPNSCLERLAEEDLKERRAMMTEPGL